MSLNIHYLLDYKGFRRLFYLRFKVIDVYNCFMQILAATPFEATRDTGGNMDLGWLGCRPSAFNFILKKKKYILGVFFSGI